MTPDETPAIPRVLRQTAADPARIDPRIAAERAALIARNPGWSFELWNDAACRDFVRDHFPPRVLCAYDALDPAYGAARADLWRYLVTWVRGGVYLDLKSTVEPPLDQLIRPEDRLILSHWQNGPGQKYEHYGLRAGWTGLARGEFQQWFLMAAPRHPLIGAVIERVVHQIETYWARRDRTGVLGVLRLTGPIAFTRAIVPQLAQHPHRVIDSEAEGIVYSIFFPDSHRALTGPGQHYTEMTAPVVHGPAAPRLARRALRLLTGAPALLRDHAVPAMTASVPAASS